MQLDSARNGPGSTLGMNLLKTLGQCVLVWAVFLWLIPELLVKIEMVAAIPNFASNHWSVLGLMLFMASSTVFLLSAWSIVWLGEGTPWPWDHRTHFVIAGPYRYVRNPLVLAGIGQALASALILGSYLGLVYLIVGVAIWNFVLRPTEEANLAHRFGQPYIEYFQNVPAWLPKLQPHRTMIVASIDEIDEVDDEAAITTP